MSLRFSPETLIFELDRQISDSNDKIDEAQGKLLILGDRPEPIIVRQATTFKIRGGQTGTSFKDVIVNQTEITAWFNENFPLNAIINSEQIKITKLEEQKRILEIESGVRTEQITEQFEPFLTGITAQFQNLIKLLTPVPAIEEEITVIPIEQNNTLRNVVVISLIAAGAVLVLR